MIALDYEHFEVIRLATLISELRQVQDVIAKKFFSYKHRAIEHSDKVRKVTEEIGEVIQAMKADPYSRENVVDEIWDSTIACIGQHFALGHSDAEILAGLKRVLEKLEKRHL